MARHLDQATPGRKDLEPPQNVPGVSVIIPAYNYDRYLPRAIESVLQQTYAQVEVIVVDDGSTDDTRVVVREYGDRVRYVYQENAGLSAARNTGIQQSINIHPRCIHVAKEWQT